MWYGEDVDAQKYCVGCNTTTRWYQKKTTPNNDTRNGNRDAA